MRITKKILSILLSASIVYSVAMMQPQALVTADENEKAFDAINNNASISENAVTATSIITGTDNYVVSTVAKYQLKSMNYIMEGMEKYSGQVGDGIADINGCNVKLNETVSLYNGKPIEKEFVITDNMNNQLEKDVDYTFEYKNNINAGQGEIIIEGKGKYFGSRTEKFEILPVNISDKNVSVDYSQVKQSYEFIGKDLTPIIRIRHNNEILNPMVDYTVEYKNNFYPGKATIIIKGIDNYSGQIVKEFEIIKKNIGNVTIRTGFNSNKELVITVNNGSWDMTKGVDYNYTVITDDKGNITITLTGLGNNYSGTVVKVIPAEENPNAPDETTKLTIGKIKIKNAKNIKGKKIKLNWKKISKITGYNVRYALSRKKLKKAKFKTIKKNSPKYVIKKLKAKKYYIQVRAYKVSDGKKYYGQWSKVKKVTVKK